MNTYFIDIQFTSQLKHIDTFFIKFTKVQPYQKYLNTTGTYIEYLSTIKKNEKLQYIFFSLEDRYIIRMEEYIIEWVGNSVSCVEHTIYKNRDKNNI